VLTSTFVLDIRNRTRDADPNQAAQGRHDHFQRDVAAGDAAQGDQPRSGVSGFRRPAGAARCADRGDEFRQEPVRADDRRAEIA
jgi:hypothetical protein